MICCARRFSSSRTLVRRWVSDSTGRYQPALNGSFSAVSKPIFANKRLNKVFCSFFLKIDRIDRIDAIETILHCPRTKCTNSSLHFAEYLGLIFRGLCTNYVKTFQYNHSKLIMFTFLQCQVFFVEHFTDYCRNSKNHRSLLGVIAFFRILLKF